MLELKYDTTRIEAGCDEAGRGCLAGPVFAAAVILPDNFQNDLLNDYHNAEYAQIFDAKKRKTEWYLP